MDSRGQRVIWRYHKKNVHSSLAEPGGAVASSVESPDASQGRGVLSGWKPPLAAALHFLGDLISLFPWPGCV